MNCKHCGEKVVGVVKIELNVKIDDFGQVLNDGSDAYIYEQIDLPYHLDYGYCEDCGTEHKLR